jgi:putative endonuclease
MRLQQHGYKVIIKNWRFKHKELDIIAQKDGKIIFIEVKTRTNPYFEAPSEAVTIKKQRLLIEAANHYLIQHQIDMEARFDVVSVIIQNGKEEVEIMEDAFYPLLRGR